MKKRNIFLLLLVLSITIFLFAESKKSYIVEKDKCIGCKLCVPVCPTKAITMISGKAVIDPEKCVNCGLCDKKCPVKAIYQGEVKSKTIVKPAVKEEKRSSTKTDVKKKSKKIAETPEKKSVYTIDNSNCTGCKECVPVCPTKAITMVNGKAVIDPEGCVNCGICAKVCAFSAPVQVEVSK